MTQDAPADRDAAMVRMERSLSDMQAAYRDVLRSAAAKVHPDLHPLGFKLLASISRRGPMSAGDAADAIHSDRAVVSRLTKELERLGLLAVTPHPEDRRSRILTLTEDAERRLAPLRGDGRSLLARSMQDWSIEDVTAYAEFNERVVAAYRVYAAPESPPTPRA